MISAGTAVFMHLKFSEEFKFHHAVGAVIRYDMYNYEKLVLYSPSNNFMHMQWYDECVLRVEPDIVQAIFWRRR